MTRQIAQAVDRGVRPELNPDLAAVHARQRGPAEVLASIAAQLNLGEEPGRGWTTTAILDRITEQRIRPVTVVVDALDEASSDSALVDALIQLARSRRKLDEKNPDRDRVVCRVLIGTRPWWDRYRDLLKELERSDQFVDLDQVSVEQRTMELREYLCEILETSQVYSGPGTAELRVATATAVAERLGVRDEAGFLLASLFAHYLVHQDAPPSVVDVVRRIPSGLPAMLQLHLGILQEEHPAMASVLAAVAHGYGQGMPLEVVHQVSSAFVTSGSTAPGLNDVQKALAAASFYLRFSTDSDGQRLYRFYHQSLVDYQRKAFERVSRSSILASVLDTLPGPAAVGERRFGLALPYVLRHAAQHAADAGELDTLLLSASFLVHCDPQLLNERPVSRSLRGRMVGLLCQAALSVGHEPWQRRLWLQDTAAMWGESWLVNALDALEEPTAQPPEHRLLQFSWGSVELPSLFAGWSPDFVEAVLVRGCGRWLAAGLTFEEQVEVWDVRTGVHLFSLSLPGDSPLTALCGGYGRFGALVAVGRSDGHIDVWDLETGSIKTAIRTDAVPVVALGIVEHGDSFLVVACGGGEVTSYDPTGSRVASLDVIGDWLCNLEADGSVGDLQEPDLDIEGYDCTAVGAVELDGVRLYVSGAKNGSVHAWEAAGKDLVWPGGSAPVLSVQTVQGPGGPVVVTGADDGTRVWDVRTGTHQPLDNIGHAGAGTLLLGEGGRPYFAYFEPGHGIRARSLDGMEDEPALLSVTPEQVSSVAVLAVDGSQLAAIAWVHHAAGSESWDEAVLLSETPHAQSGSLLWGVSHASAVDLVAVPDQGGSHISPAVSVEKSEIFKVWDSATGTLLTSGQRRGITAVATGRLAEAGVVVVAHGFGRRGCIEVLNADTGEPVGPPLEWEAVMALSIGELGGRPTLVVHASDGIFFINPGDQEPRQVLYANDGRHGGTRFSALGRLKGEFVGITVHAWDPDLTEEWVPDNCLMTHMASGEDRTLAQGIGEVTCVAAGQWGNLDVVFIGGVEGAVTVWCLETGEELAHFQGHEGEVVSVLFVEVRKTPLLVSTGADSYVRVWDCSQQGALLNETGFPDLLGAVAVNDAGVFAGYGSRVAFLAWTDLGSVAGSSEKTESR